MAGAAVGLGAAPLDVAAAPVVIDGAVAHFVCRRSAVHRGGDHDIIVGEVIDLDTPRDVPALVFYTSTYCEPG